MLGTRLSGYIIMLLGALFAAATPIIHMTGTSYATIGEPNGGLCFVWTLLAIGTTGTLSVILSVRGLWGLQA